MKYFSKIFSSQEFFVFFAAILLAVYLHLPALLEEDRFHNNWRQAPHWLSPENQSFQDDDLLLEYAEFNTSPVADFIFQNLSKTGIDIYWGKLLAILYFAITVLLIFITSKKMYNETAGWISAIIFGLFSMMFEEYSGGFMSAFSSPLILLTIYVIYTKKWWWIPPIILLESLSYPMAAVHSGAILFIDFLINDKNNIGSKEYWKEKYVPIVISILFFVSVVALKYLSMQHDFGELVSRAEIQNRGVFTTWGRSPIIPVKSIWLEFENKLGTWFTVLFFVSSFYYLGKSIFKLPRGLYALLFGSIFIYIIADILLMKLYIPNRYFHYSLPFFFSIAGGFWWANILRLEKDKIVGALKNKFNLKLPKIYIVTVALVLIGFISYSSSLVPGLQTKKYDDHNLYSFIKELPGKPMIAIHPTKGSEIPITTGKTVFLSMELSHPWWTSYWNVIKKRTQDYFKAYYSYNPDEIVSFIEKNKIDYWIINRKHFSSKYIKRRIYIRPFNNWIKRKLTPSSRCVLNNIPQKYWDYNEGTEFGISSDNLLQYFTDVRK